MKKIKIGVVGIGHLGARHLKCYLELPELVTVTAVCDADPQRAERLPLPAGLPFMTDYRQLLGKVDAVSICVPTTLHFEIARFFLENSVHVLVEKPMTTTVEQADELIRLAAAKGLRLQVGHVERFNSAYLSIQHFTKNPLFIECHRLNPFPNRSLDIGVVLDLMIHDIDIVLGLNACKVKDFHAVGVQVLTEREDIASVRVIFENGCVCNLTASRVSEDVMRKIRIFLPEAYISLDYVKQEAFIYKRQDQRILKHALPIEKEEPLRKELESFAVCVRDGVRPVVAGEEGRDALRLALEITAMIAESRRELLARLAKTRSVDIPVK